MSSEGYSFSIQYEDIMYVLNNVFICGLFIVHNRVPDTVDLNELKNMLQNSTRIS